MEIKGIIEIGESLSLTCCDSLIDLKIGGESLYQKLEELFNQDADEYWHSSEKESPQYSMRYVILDEAPDENKSFDSLSSEVVMNMLYCEHISGCYSEWTCGYGGFDYVVNDDAHSIFNELKGSVGKYVHIEL